MNISSHSTATDGKAVAYDYLPLGEEPNAYDVICERGVTGASHEGNREFSLVILDWRATYSGLFFEINDFLKKAIVSKIIHHIKNGRERPGRFVSRDKATKRWYKAPEAVEQKRVAQALRDAHAPQWAYEQKIEELRPIYKAADSDDKREEAITYVLVYLRGGRLDKGHFKSWKSTRIPNEPGAKRRFRTEITETAISEEDAGDWVRKELEGRERSRMNEGIKYVIESGGRTVQKKAKKRRGKTKSSPPAAPASTKGISEGISEGIKSMHISEAGTDHSRKSRIDPPKRVKRCPPTPVLTKNGSSRRLNRSAGGPPPRNSYYLQKQDRPGKAAESPERNSTGFGGNEFAQPRYVHSSSNGARPSVDPDSMDTEQLVALLESRRQPPLSEIVLDGANEESKEEMDRRKQFQRLNSLHSLRSIQSTFSAIEAEFTIDEEVPENGEIVLASDRSTTSNRRTGRWRIGKNRSFSSFGRSNTEEFADVFSSPGSLGSMHGTTSLSSIGGPMSAHRRPTAQIPERAKEAQESPGFSAFSPGSMQSSITGNFSQLLFTSLKNQPPNSLPLHDGSMPLNDAASCISLPNSINSMGNLGASASPNSSLCAPVSPGRIF